MFLGLIKFLPKDTFFYTHKTLLRYFKLIEKEIVLFVARIIYQTKIICRDYKTSLKKSGNFSAELFKLLQRSM